MTKSYSRKIFIIIIILALIGLKYEYDRRMKLIDEVVEKMKEDDTLDNYSNNKSQFPLENFSVDFEKRLSYNNSITTNFKIENTLNEVIEDASIDIKIHLKYKSDKYILTTFQNLKKSNYGEITNLKSILHRNEISHNNHILNHRELGNLINVNLKPYIKDKHSSLDMFIYYASDRNTDIYFKTRKILDSIESKYNDVWYPNETKDLSILFPIKIDTTVRDFYKKNNRYYKDELITINKDGKKLPNTKLFIAENVFLQVFLNAKNSNNINIKSLILTKDITSEWNRQYLSEKIRVKEDKNNYKVLKELIIPIENWDIIDENYFEKIDLGTLLLGKNIETKELNYFSVLYQKHSLPELKDYALQEKDREIRTFKNQGVNLILKNTSRILFKNKNAILYRFSGAFENHDFELKMLVFKHNDFYYKISYKVDENSENLIDIIKFKV